MRPKGAHGVWREPGSMPTAGASLSTLQDPTLSCRRKQASPHRKTRGYRGRGRGEHGVAGDEVILRAHTRRAVCGLGAGAGTAGPLQVPVGPRGLHPQVPQKAEGLSGGLIEGLLRASPQQASCLVVGERVAFIRSFPYTDIPNIQRTRATCWVSPVCTGEATDPGPRGRAGTRTESPRARVEAARSGSKPSSAHPVSSSSSAGLRTSTNG